MPLEGQATSAVSEEGASSQPDVPSSEGGSVGYDEHSVFYLEAPDAACPTAKRVRD